MRRALLLAALAAPAVATAQSGTPAGQISFADGNDNVRGQYINAFECDAANNTVVTLTWSLSPLTAGATQVPANHNIEVYAANLAQTAAQDCNPINVEASGYKVHQVASTAGTIIASSMTQSADFQTAAFPGEDIGVSCSNPTDTNIYVCVRAVSNGVVFGFAKANMILSISKPGKVLNVKAAPDDQALQVSWSEPSTGYDYLVRATSVLDKTGVDLVTPDPNDPYVHQYWSGAHATKLRADRLVNGVQYLVKVTARTIAGTLGDPSDADVLETPVPVNDFWDEYKRAGGQDSGGCGAGAAGPVALLGVAALLAALRRRA